MMKYHMQPKRFKKFDTTRFDITNLNTKGRRKFNARNRSFAKSRPKGSGRLGGEASSTSESSSFWLHHRGLTLSAAQRRNEDEKSRMYLETMVLSH